MTLLGFLLIPLAFYALYRHIQRARIERLRLGDGQGCDCRACEEVL